MGAGAGPCQAVELEGMGEGAIGERRSRGLDRRSASAEDTAFAAGAGARGVVDNDAAPRQGAAANPGSDGVDDTVLGLLHDRCGQVLVPQFRRIARQSYRLVGHLPPPEAPPRLLRYARNDNTAGCHCEFPTGRWPTALDETWGRRVLVGWAAVGKRSALHGAEEPDCELDPRSLEDRHWRHGRDAPEHAC